MLFLLNLCYAPAKAQRGSSIALDKPEKYENRRLGAEKTEDKKFNTSRHIYQNMVTHYNYFFNANTKFNGVLDKARQSAVNDYTQLLPYYNYDLNVTSRETNELDSIIYKCTAGILLHNLNNDWIDDMYLLLGKAYLLRKNFDSATHVFRYINYAFAPKDDGYDIPIGSNVSNTNGEFTIATDERRNAWQKVTTHHPSRNSGLLWLARTYIESGAINEAAGLLEILKADPHFPERLQPELHEVMGYWFYTQQVYDSAAVQLNFTLDHTGSRQERARREYLIGQLYLLGSRNEDLASSYFLKSASHTIDPVLEAYATLASIRLSTNKGDVVFLQQKLAKLLQLAKREKYILYRDVVYYAAAQVAMDLNRPKDAQSYLWKSVASATNNPTQRSLSFLLLGDINYDTKDYVAAHNAYDSIDNGQLKKTEDQSRVEQRKPSLTTIANNVTTVQRQDSLQHLAALPAATREEEVRKIARKLRRSQGLKDEDKNFVNTAVRNVAPATLFSETNASASEWYFNNTSLKSSGVAEFNTRWGKRPNVDNWRRSSAIDPMTRNQAQVAEEIAKAQKDSAAAAGTDTLSFDALMGKLPLSPEKMAASDEKIIQALFSNAKVFQSELQDYPTAIETYNELLRRYPETKMQEEVLFNLNYCYRRLGDTRRQDSVKTAMQRAFPNSKWTQLVNKSDQQTPKEADAATKHYERVYDLFVEGNFEKAKQEKQLADSLYGGKNNWSPQLLYIEAVYYIKQRDDSTAIQRLTDLKQAHAGTPLAEKATTMIDVLKRRKEIEEYLTNLQVTRADEDIPLLTDAAALSVIPNKPVLVIRDTLATAAAPARIIEVKRDTIPVVTVKKFAYNPEEEHFVVLFLNKVDGVYVNEARNAFSRFNRENFYSEKIDIGVHKLNDSTQMLLMGPFPKAVLAMGYIDKARPASRSRILPWLKPEKYEYGIISPSNLTLLKQDNELEAYKELLKQALPGKF
ncbi:type IX secretion system periplasmic lipoprotein PorW/SprE [Filimonas effusa]|uniref:Tetratricopeptide repeat protein n=1 Tax=Filimonas effusa TaxID=2508721 RepID=A0A4Q1CZ84_9BACT|nr:tetratricopeptide repeat protein [Filimonas effusa]RXK80573.1 hypothetical protein ESB13_23350 [Filimonas effusa]